MVYLSLLYGSGRASQPARGGGAARGPSKEVEYVKSSPRDDKMAHLLLPWPLLVLRENAGNGKKLVVFIFISTGIIYLWLETYHSTR